MITISWVTVAKIAVFTAIAMTIINLILKRKSGGIQYVLVHKTKSQKELENIHSQIKETDEKVSQLSKELNKLNRRKRKKLHFSFRKDANVLLFLCAILPSYYVGYALLWLLLVKWAILPSINIPEIYLIITRLVFGILLSFVITVKIRCYSQIDREIMQAAGKNKELIIKG